MREIYLHGSEVGKAIAFSTPIVAVQRALKHQSGLCAMAMTGLYQSRPINSH